MLSTFLGGIAVVLMISLIAVVWFMWRSGCFKRDKDD
jgi:hypothetical protein